MGFPLYELFNSQLTTPISGFYEVEVNHNGAKVSAVVELVIDESIWTNSVEE